MTAKIDGTNGLLQQYDYQTPSTGFSYTFAAGTQMLFMVPAGTLATGTITMPSAPADGMVITFSSSQQITALTLQGNTGQSISGAVTFLPAQTAASYVYRLANLTWYPCETVPGTGSQLVSGTSQATTSGTSKDFTGIPSWVKRITVMFYGVSTNGSSVVTVRLGTSGGIESTGYLGIAANNGTTTTAYTYLSDGFSVMQSSGPGVVFYGQMIISAMGGNIWTATGSVGRTDNTFIGSTQGGKTLSGTLTQLQITTPAGDTFDAGSVNILYE
jgi:hypothetical protein